MAERDFKVGQNIVADNLQLPTETTISTNSATTIASFDKDTADNVEFTVKVVQGDRRLSTKALALHNGITADLVQYGEISISATEPVSGTGATVWVTQTSNFGTSAIYSIAYGNNLWAAGGNDGQLRTSTDTVTWVTRTSNALNTIESISYDNNTWVAVGYATVRSSTDAITWTTRISNFGNTGITCVAYGNGIWVISGHSGKLASSTDAITWVTRESNISNEIRNVFYGDGKWVAAAGGGGYGGYAAVSTDAVTWTSYIVPTSFPGCDMHVVAYGNGRWVIGGESAEIGISTDAITWTSVTSHPGYGIINTFESLVYANGLFVSVENDIYSDPPGPIKTSTDGITWVTQTHPFGLYQAFQAGYGNGKWVAVGDNGILATSDVDTVIAEIPATFSADISGSDVRLRATITDAATTSASVSVLQTTL